jgi:3-phenylpropionate/cinnamic acid dioxygenase small subunit
VTTHVSAPDAVTTGELLAQVRRLTDRADLQDIVHRYALACDRRDIAAWRSLFTADARAKYGKDDWLDGADAIISWLAQATEPTTWGHHFISPYSLDLAGDEADLLCYLLSHQIFEQDPDEVTMMTSRYQLHCRRGSLGWQISELLLTVGWFEVRRGDQTLVP